MKTSPALLTEGVIWKRIVAFALPVMASNLLQQLYNAVDSAVVGRFAGSQALAAVGSTGSLISLLVGFFLGVATGAGVIYANFVGARDHRSMKDTIATSILVGAIGGGLLTVLGLILSPSLLGLMNTPEDVMGLSNTYLRIYFAGTIPMLVYNVGAGLIRAGGDSSRPLLYLIISGLTNLVVDLVLVAGFKLGVAGAAWATVLSQTVSAVLVIIHLTRLPGEYCLELKKLRLDRRTAARVLKIGVPCGLQSSMFNIANMLVQTKINSFGSVVMAGCAAYSKIDGFLYMPMMAMGLAVSTFVGQNLGAGRQDRLKSGVNASLLMTMGASVALGVTVLLSGKYLLRAFTDEEEVIQYGLQMMSIMAPSVWVFSFAEVYAGAVRGAGAALPAVIINAGTICVFRVLWLLLLLPLVPDIRVVYCCYPASWILCSIVFGIYYYKGKWMNALKS